MTAARSSRYAAVCVGVGLLAMGQVWADPATVPVGDPGNAADGTGYGAVAYKYNIGKYEVSNAEYCEFLNAAAKKDTFDLYNYDMTGEYGGITQSGSWGSHTYSVKDGWGNKPVNYVSWYDALRFCNWLSNGKGTNTTETGVYTFSNESGYGSSREWSVAMPDHAALAAGKTAKWVLTSENEWYKAAYFDPAKSGAAGYWEFPAKSDSESSGKMGNGGVTDVGGPASAYGTCDQSGSMWEWNETQDGGRRGVRGGSWYLNDRADYGRKSVRYVSNPATFEWPAYGFRVAKLGGSK
jgi:formylglycine-generating enzyme